MVFGFIQEQVGRFTRTIERGIDRGRRVFDGVLNGSEKDEKQDQRMHQNENRSVINELWNGLQQGQINQLQRIAKEQGVSLKELKGDLTDVAKELNLDITDPNMAQILLRVSEIKNSDELTDIIGSSMAKVEDSTALSDDQKARLNKKLVDLEQIVKLKYQDNESSFNLDDKNLKSLISILGSVDTFVDKVDSEKKDNPDFEVSTARFDNYSQRVSNAIGRVGSGLRVEKPDPEGSLAFA